MATNSINSYVKSRLERWGEVFALHKDADYLGHASKNVLAVLIENKGDMPVRSVGIKPIEIDQEALEIEEFVSKIAMFNMQMACVLRGYYCGTGRRKFERFDTANKLLKKQGHQAVSQRTYMTMHDYGVHTISGFLIGKARMEAY